MFLTIIYPNVDQCSTTQWSLISCYQLFLSRFLPLTSPTKITDKISEQKGVKRNVSLNNVTLCFESFGIFHFSKWSYNAYAYARIGCVYSLIFPSTTRPVLQILLHYILLWRYFDFNLLHFIYNRIYICICYIYNILYITLLYFTLTGSLTNEHADERTNGRTERWTNS